MVVDVILLQNSTSIVIEINSHLFSTVNSIVSEDRVTASGDPHSSQSIRVNLVTFYKASTVVMLKGGWVVVHKIKITLK